MVNEEICDLGMSLKPGVYEPGPGDSALSEGGLMMVPGPCPPKETVVTRFPWQ